MAFPLPSPSWFCLSSLTMRAGLSSFLPFLLSFLTELVLLGQIRPTSETRQVCNFLMGSVSRLTKGRISFKIQRREWFILYFFKKFKLTPLQKKKPKKIDLWLENDAVFISTFKKSKQSLNVCISLCFLAAFFNLPKISLACVYLLMLILPRI